MDLKEKFEDLKKRHSEKESLLIIAGALAMENDYFDPYEFDELCDRVLGEE